MTHVFPVLLLAVCCVAGLLLVPLGLPGLWVMVLGVIGYGWLTGFETFDIVGLDGRLRPRASLTVRARDAGGAAKEFKVLCRIDTPEELRYYENGGILPYVLRQLVGGR